MFEGEFSIIAYALQLLAVGIAFVSVFAIGSSIINFKRYNKMINSLSENVCDQYYQHARSPNGIETLSILNHEITTQHKDAQTHITAALKLMIGPYPNDKRGKDLHKTESRVESFMSLLAIFALVLLQDNHGTFRSFVYISCFAPFICMIISSFRDRILEHNKAKTFRYLNAIQSGSDDNAFDALSYAIGTNINRHDIYGRIYKTLPYLILSLDHNKLSQDALNLSLGNLVDTFEKMQRLDSHDRFSFDDLWDEYEVDDLLDEVLAESESEIKFNEMIGPSLGDNEGLSLEDILNDDTFDTLKNKEGNSHIEISPEEFKILDEKDDYAFVRKVSEIKPNETTDK